MSGLAEKQANFAEQNDLPTLEQSVPDDRRSDSAQVELLPEILLPFPLTRRERNSEAAPHQAAILPEVIISMTKKAA